MKKRGDERLSRRLGALSRATKIEAPPPKVRNPRKERAADRRSTYRPGIVVDESGAETSCIIKNLSEAGARIVLEGEAALSPRVVLKIVQCAEKRAAEIIWQRECEAGLKFIRR